MGIVPDPAPAEGNGRVASRAEGASAQVQIDCLSAHVQAVLGHAPGAPAQHGIGPRGAITTEDLKFAVGPSGASLQIVKQVEELGIDYRNLVGPVIAQEPIELPQRIALIAIADAVGDFDLFACMKVAKGEDARRVVLSCGEDGRCRSGQGQPEKVASIHNPPVSHRHPDSGKLYR